MNACVHNLNWTHFRALLRVPDENARMWYMNEAAQEGWSSRTLDRNISTQYYYRLMQSPKKDAVMNEMLQKTAENQRNKFELLKSPIVAEFLGFKNEDSYIESDLESAILTHIRDFLMEMGKGFAFVARQQHIVTETEDYFIDLVFYNIELKCYVLIDLKMGKITHQDVGQIDMYVRMYDELKCKEGDNPTLGILLCAETDEDIARYSVPHDNDRLFMSKYLTYLPTKDYFYYACKHRKLVDGHRCTYKRQWNEDRINAAVEEIIRKFVKNPKFEQEIRKQIGSSIDTSELDREYDGLKDRLSQTTGAKNRLADQMDHLSVSDKNYDKKCNDMQERLDKLYDEITDIENAMEEVETRLYNIRQDKISEDNVYQFLLFFDKLYDKFTDLEKKTFLKSFLSDVFIYEEEQKDGRILKGLRFKFPIYMNGRNVLGMDWDNESTDETVVLLLRKEK